MDREAQEQILEATSDAEVVRTIDECDLSLVGGGDGVATFG